MNTKRPINLQLTQMKFPVMAIISILHRISGVVLFVSLPFILHYLGVSLRSEQGYYHLEQFFSQPLMKLMMFLVISGLIYHLVAGVRHIIMDLGWGETLQGGRIGAWVVVAVSALLIIVMGVYIW